MLAAIVSEPPIEARASRPERSVRPTLLAMCSEPPIMVTCARGARGTEDRPTMNKSPSMMVQPGASPLYTRSPRQGGSRGGAGVKGGGVAGGAGAGGGKGGGCEGGGTGVAERGA